MTESTAFHLVVVKTLLELHNARGSGAVRAQRGSEKKQLIVRDGCLSFAESNLQEDHLARVLVKLNLLPKAKLANIASLMMGGKPSDQALREATTLSAAEIDQGAREQALQILASLLGWEAAEIRSYGPGSIPKRELHLGIPLPELLILSARRAVSQRTIPRSLKELGGNLAPAPEFASALLAIPLDSGEALAYSYVQQPVAVEDVLPSLSATGVRPDELIQRLLLLGYLRRQDSAVAAVEEGDAAPSAETGLAESLDQLLHRFETAGLYEILSVAPEASDNEIKDTYHDLARQYHPDRFQSRESSPSVRAKAERAFAYITGAYEVLGDPAKRAAYDADRLKKDSRVEAVLHTRSTLDVEREKMAEALFRAGRVSLAKGQVDKAVEQLKEAVWLRPAMARYHHYLGVAQTRNPKLRKEAEHHLLKSIELDGMQAAPYLALGKLYISVNLPRRAETQLQEALRWDPENLEAQKLLQELATARGEHAGPPRHFKKPYPRS